ncbi:uncharacterized protein LOC129899893 [Solanum dulcamara]|uniref:uncharacterized protein LOC129899893 n=1 Tax=Solanum dulcamara TaxID=45834 RepID=UPI002485735E|nr:uncharacterized protein LOC129899893 [Solanum dulcamara]
MYIDDLDFAQRDDLPCLSAHNEDADLWHKRLGHVSSLLLNKLVSKELVHGLPKVKFTDGKIQSRSGKKYILVIVDDYSRYTWTMFLRFKYETYEVLMIYDKMIKKKLNCKIVGIRSDHGTEFENAKLDNFCVESRIHHNFSSLITPQQNGVIERKNRTLDQDLDVIEPEPVEEVNEDAEPEVGPGLFENTALEDIVQPESGSFENKDEENDQQHQPSTYQSRWKHRTSHLLDNLISPLNSGLQTRSKTRNLVAFLEFISSIEPKNIKEVLKDADWVNSMQEALHQFE